MNKKIYKLYSTNNSFDAALRILCNNIYLEYNALEIIFTSHCNIDNTRVGYNLSNMVKPDYLYVRVNFLHKGHFWTNSGGIEFCKMILKDDHEISVRWDTGKHWIGNDKPEIFDVKLIRKLKLEKLNTIT